jgi:hypothetical protein
MATEGPAPVGDDRAVTPAVSKSLEATVVVLFVGALTVTLYGGVVPEYRTAAGEQVADRTLAAASHQVESAVPPEAERVEVKVRADIPETIRGEGYSLRVQGRELVLDHPHRGVGDRARLALPRRVVSVTGEWHSRRDAWVVVEDQPGGLAVRLRQGSPSPRHGPHGKPPSRPQAIDSRPVPGATGGSR